MINKFNKDQFIFILYLVIIIALTYIHDLYFFSICLFIIIFYKIIILKKTVDRSIINIIFISVVLSLSYVLYNFFKTKHIAIEYFLLFNLRILNIYFLTSIVLNSISVFHLLNFSMNLKIYTVLILSIIYNYHRSYMEYREILMSKGFKLFTFFKQIESLSHFIIISFKKLKEDWEEISLIMESRGFYFYE